MDDLTTPRVQQVVREARDHAGITNAGIAEAINREWPNADYDKDRVRQELCRGRLGMERIRRLVIGAFDAIMVEDGPRRREAARWLLAEAERLGIIEGPWGETEILARRLVEAVTPAIWRNDPVAARNEIIRIFREQDLDTL